MLINIAPSLPAPPLPRASPPSPPRSERPLPPRPRAPPPPVCRRHLGRLQVHFAPILFAFHLSIRSARRSGPRRPEFGPSAPAAGPGISGTTAGGRQVAPRRAGRRLPPSGGWFPDGVLGSRVRLHNFDFRRTVLGMRDRGTIQG